MNLIKFGIGAFWFIPRNIEQKDSISDEYYIDLLTLGLGKHSCIDLTTFRANHDETFSKSVSQRNNWTKQIKDGGEYPLPNFFELRFNITIPLDWQKKNIHPIRPNLTINGPIEITVKSQFHYSATYLRIINNEDVKITDGSQAVFVSRKYLAALFKNDPHLSFISVGPSPFHADFELHKGDFPPKTTKPFEYTRIPERGYDKIVFKYNIEEFNDIREAYNELTLYEIGEEIGFYYYIKGKKIKLSKAWNSLENNHHKLIELASLGAATKLLNMKNIDNHTQNSLIKIIEFDTEYQNTINYIKTVSEQQKAKGTTSYLDHFIALATQGLPEFDTKKFYSFSEFIEKRQSKKWEIGILAMAGLVGAMLGGLLQKA